MYPPAFYKRLENERRMHPELNLGELQLCEGNRLGYIVKIPGPPNTPYEGIMYDLEVAFDSSYPFSAPYLCFRTPIFHPNIHKSGRMSNLMVEAWAPHKSVATIYDSAIQLLAQPLKEYPYNDAAAVLWETDPIKFYMEAKAAAATATATPTASQRTHPSAHPSHQDPSETVPAHTDTDMHP